MQKRSKCINRPMAVACGMLISMCVTSYADLFVSPMGSDANTGGSWGQALATISNAVAKAGTSGQIWVSNGVYTVGAEIAVTNGLTLTGYGGSEHTVVQGNDSFGRIFRIDHTDAVLDGFAITRGTTLSSDLRGAGVLLLNGTVRACVISNNVSGLATQGSGIYVADGLLTNCLIRANLNKGYGAGVYMAGGYMVDCIIRENGDGKTSSNYRTIEGTGVFLGAGSLAERCVIEENLASGSGAKGGGACLNGGTMRGCLIRNNSALGNTSYAAGIYLRDGLVESCLIVSNICLANYGGGGVTIAGGTLVNCTVANNRSAMVVDGKTLEAGAGVQWAGDGSIINSIIYNNTCVGSQAQINLGGHPNYLGAFQYCCAPELTAGVNGNLSADPRFVDPAGGNYRLHPVSSCIDAGSESGVAWDYDGAARPLDGNGDAVAETDIGAFERQDVSQAFTCFFRIDEEEGMGTLDAHFEASVFGPNTNGLYYRWDFGNGSQEGFGLRQVDQSYVMGRYDVSLTVSNEINEVASWSLADCIRVGASTSYVAPTGSHEFPFDTWAKAATNILSAVQAAVVTPEGATRVVVSNGTYAVSSSSASILINRGITVESLAGAEQTIVSGTAGYDVYPNFDLDHPDAVVEGFTSRDANCGAAVKRGTLRGCILRDNVGDGRRGSNSGAGAGLWIAGGIATACEITNNRAIGSNNMRGGGVYMTGTGVVQNCVIAGNGIDIRMNNYGGGVALIDLLNRPTLRNCLVVGNDLASNYETTPPRGAGVYLEGGSVENCTIVTNCITRFGEKGTGLYVERGDVVNTIIFGNTLPLTIPDDLWFEAGQTTVSNCCAPELTSGVQGNINRDPLFTNAADGDYSLLPDSPCINQGENLNWMEDGFDLAGEKRIVAGTVDLGAYEFARPATLFLVR